MSSYDTPTTATGGHLEERATLPLEWIEIGPGVEPSPSTDTVDPEAGSPDRRVGLVRTAAIAAVVLAIGAAWALGARQRPVPAPAAIADIGPPAAVTGLAELLVTSYLTGNATDDPALRLLYPAAPPLPVGEPVPRYVSQAVTVDAVHDPERGWTVTVAADVLTFDGQGYRRDGLHHYLVGIVETDGRPGATSLPTRIATPNPAEIAATVVGSPVNDEPLLALVDGFLAAYSCGDGDLRPFISSGSTLHPIVPPPHRQVRIDLVTAVTLEPDRMHLRVLATATEESGAQIPTEHHVLVGIEGGVWKVMEMNAGPLLATAVSSSRTDTG